MIVYEKDNRIYSSCSTNFRNTFLGYKVVYKASPRDFITKDTRIIYANEGINTKNFNPFVILDRRWRGEKGIKFWNGKFKIYL